MTALQTSYDVDLARCPETHIRDRHPSSSDGAILLSRSPLAIAHGTLRVVSSASCHSPSLRLSATHHHPSFFVILRLRHSHRHGAADPRPARLRARDESQGLGPAPVAVVIFVVDVAERRVPPGVCVCVRERERKRETETLPLEHHRTNTAHNKPPLCLLSVMIPSWTRHDSAPSVLAVCRPPTFHPSAPSQG